MKKIIFVLIIVLASTQVYSNSFPTELDTLVHLERELKNLEHRYRTTQLIQFISFSGFGAGIVLSSVAETMNSLELLEENQIKNMRMSSTILLSSTAIISLATAIINNKQHQKILDQQEVLNEYLLNSEYERSRR